MIHKMHSNANLWDKEASTRSLEFHLRTFRDKLDHLLCRSERRKHEVGKGE